MKGALRTFVVVLLFTGAAVAQGPWSTPVDLGAPVNDIQADFQEAISPDGLSLYVVKFCGPPDPTCNSNNAIMWVCHRATKSDAWGSPEQLPPTINLVGKTKAAPYISADGHWMYYTSNRIDVGNFGGADLLKSYRNNTAVDSGLDGWQKPTNLGASINSSKNEQMGCIITDDTTGVTTMYFSSNRAARPDPNPGSGAGLGGFANDIYVSTLQADGNFGPATPVAELNDQSASQLNPTCSSDGLEMYFASDRVGSISYPITPDNFFGPSGKPSPDIWVTTRATTSESWGPPQNVDQFNASLGGPQINDPYHDGRPSLSTDGTELYFFSPSWRAGCQGPSCFFHIFVSTRPDTTPPRPPTPHANPGPNAAGWNNTDVTVSFTANGDPGHISTGVAGCTADLSLTAETAETRVDGTCRDNAGNVSDPAGVTVRLDKTPPVVQVTGVVGGATYLLGAVPVPGCNSSDPLSGLATSAELSVTGGNALGAGSFTALCSGASDNAGNVAPPIAANYSVVYQFSGFTSPVTGGTFHLGRTLPIKWELLPGSLLHRNAAGINGDYHGCHGQGGNTTLCGIGLARGDYMKVSGDRGRDIITVLVDQTAAASLLDGPGDGLVRGPHHAGKELLAIALGECDGARGDRDRYGGRRNNLRRSVRATSSTAMRE